MILSLILDSAQRMIPVVHGSEFQKKLYKHLFKDYDTRIRPVLKDEDLINVTLRLNMYQLISIKEKVQHIDISGWINQVWKDSYLSWKPHKFGNIKEIHVDPTLIWKPDVVLYNNIDENIAEYGGNLDTLKTRIIVDHKGIVSWFTPVLLKAQCSINVAHFPFDVQQCTFKFGSATYDKSQVNVLGECVDIRNYAHHQKWTLLSTKTERNELEYTCCPGTLYADVTFHLHFQRRSLFYVLNLIFPIVMITVLTIWIFILPAQTGERMSVGVTLLLAVTVFMILVTEMIPESSESVPLVGRFFIFCMVIMFFIIISVGFVNDVYNRTGRDRAMDSWTRVHILEKMSFVTGVRDEQPPDVVSRVSMEAVNYESVSMNSGEISHHSVCFMDERLETDDENIHNNEIIKNKKGHAVNKEDDAEKYMGTGNHNFRYTPEEEWKIVGKTLDRLFFVFFTFLFIIGSVWCFGTIDYCH